MRTRTRFALAMASELRPSMVVVTGNPDGYYSQTVRAVATLPNGDTLATLERREIVYTGKGIRTTHQYRTFAPGDSVATYIEG